MLYEEDDPRKLNAEHVHRLKLIFTILDAVDTLDENMGPPNFPAVLWLHRLKGNLQGFWAVTVHANLACHFSFR
jgi:hypothetical protein